LAKNISDASHKQPVNIMLRLIHPCSHTVAQCTHAVYCVRNLQLVLKSQPFISIVVMSEEYNSYYDDFD